MLLLSKYTAAAQSTKNCNIGVQMCPSLRGAPCRVHGRPYIRRSTQSKRWHLDHHVWRPCTNICQGGGGDEVHGVPCPPHRASWMRHCCKAGEHTFSVAHLEQQHSLLPAWCLRTPKSRTLHHISECTTMHDMQVKIVDKPSQACIHWHEVRLFGKLHRRTCPRLPACMSCNTAECVNDCLMWQHCSCILCTARTFGSNLVAKSSSSSGVLNACHITLGTVPSRCSV